MKYFRYIIRILIIIYLIYPLNKVNYCGNNKLILVNKKLLQENNKTYCQVVNKFLEEKTTILLKKFLRIELSEKLVVENSSVFIQMVDYIGEEEFISIVKKLKKNRKI